MNLNYLHMDRICVNNERLASDKDFQSRFSLCSAESKHVMHIDR